MSQLQVEVLFPYEAADKNQLSLVVGERVTVMQGNERGWWIGSKADGSMGLFPAAYCREVRDAPKFAVSSEMKSMQLHEHPLSQAPPSQNATPMVSLNGSTQQSSGNNFAARRQRQDELRREMGFDDDADGMVEAHADPSGASSGNGIITGGGPSPKMDEVIRLRATKAAIESDLKKIRKAQAKRKVELAEKEARCSTLLAQRADNVRKVHEKGELLADLNARTEVLQAAFMDEPLPEYVPPGGTARAVSSTSATSSGMGSPVQSARAPAPSIPPSSAATSAAPSTVASPRSMSPRVRHDGLGPAPSVADPDTDIASDKARKLYKKYVKRIAEAVAVRDDEERRLRKYEKKVAKRRAELEAVEAEAQLHAQERKYTAAAANDASAKAGRDAEAALAAATAELEDVRAKVKGLQKDVAKVQKKLAKGGAATQVINEDIAAAEAWQQNFAAEKAKAEARVAALEREVAEARTTAAKGRTSLDDAKAKEQAFFDDINARVAKDRARIAEYQAAIAKCQQQLAEAAASK